MTEPADPPAPPLRTWRPMAAWTAAILLALGLIWFVAAVVVPVWQVRQAVLKTRKNEYLDPALGLKLVEDLGGPAKAAPKLVLYIRMPKSIAPQCETAAMLLGSCGKAGALQAVELLSSPNLRGRISDACVLDAIWRMGPDGDVAVPAIVPLLQDPSSFIRFKAAAALCVVGPRAQEAFSALLLGLKDPCEDVRYFSAMALEKIGDRRAVEPLIECLQDKSDLVRRDAARALATLGDPRAVEPLLASLETCSPGGEAQWAIASALAKFKDPRCIRPMIERLRKGDPWVPVLVLGSIGPAARDALPDLKRWSGVHIGSGSGTSLERAINEAITNIQREEAGR